GGECDLQDQAFKYGNGESFFKENKRSVADKNLGPFIKTYMTRCIHCTRCIRFLDDIAGSQEIGATGRGENMEITSYLEKNIISEMSGNIIDLCPVGALTSKPYSFSARSWELKPSKAIDLMDSLGSNLYIDTMENQVMRVRPDENCKISNGWITDKTRFSYDGFSIQRINNFYVREKNSENKSKGKLKICSKEEAFNNIKQAIEALQNEKQEKYNRQESLDKFNLADKIAAISGEFTSMENLFLLKKMINKLSSDNYHSKNFLNSKFNQSIKSKEDYIINNNIENIKSSDFILLISTNVRQNNPLTNSLIVQNSKNNNNIYKIGNFNIKQNYNINMLSDNLLILDNIIKNEANNKLDHNESNFLTNFKNSKDPVIIIGKDAYINDDFSMIKNSINKFITKYHPNIKPNNIINILHNNASDVGACSLNFFSNNSINTAKILFLNAYDDIDHIPNRNNKFIIYMGHHGDRGASIADVILPITCPNIEEDGSYQNNFGLIQQNNKIIKGPSNALYNYAMIIELENYLLKTKQDINIKTIRNNMITEINHINDNRQKRARKTQR
ncbi:MAG TPA: molybdopterin-dependent oxidoreductase, partial [Candidatus Megaira endosymbiont of Hartmannula sinica]|nr:molybdopterin-dependent oxidoreductase [Candidatus Megaera endosymbiont of Hartmannula sinica]